MIFVDGGEEDVDGGVIDVSRNSRHSVAAVGTGPWGQLRGGLR